ncbi:site-specific DNA-methyltransferase [Rhodoblastus sp.]|uniref:site-specific DNA-methyltransferase n=1 Tax=Rhodoblastus sp. TaxID=1962975 RepID=UPI003F99FF68
MTKRSIEMIAINQLVPHERNARTHSKKQIRGIAKSIERFGFRNPVLATSENRIIVGHGRVEAAKSIGLKEVPVLRYDDMTPDEVRAYVLADNQLATSAGWDQEALAIELQYLVSIDFDIETIGFEIPKVDLILDAEAAKANDPGLEDDIPARNDGPPISRTGDLWLFGPAKEIRHKLLVGDARSPADYAALMEGGKAAMMITAPPYNVPIAGHVSGLGRNVHREFTFASGEMGEEEFVVFLAAFMEQAGQHLSEGALHYVFMDWRHSYDLQSAARRLGLSLLNMCVWKKTNAGMGSLYRSMHELCLIFKQGAAPHRNNVELGKHGRSRSNVWTYAGANSFRAGRDEDLADHPTVKPAQMIADAIRDVTKRGDVVLDPFVGSGTILIAAEMTGLKARGIEIDPAYADVAIRRFEAFTGKSAILAATGENFEAVAEGRMAELVLA